MLRYAHYMLRYVARCLFACIVAPTSVACSHLFKALSRYTMESVVSMFSVSM